MTENPTTTPARLTDDEGGTLHVYPWASGRVSLVARDGDHRAEFGPVERHVLLDAIREVAGEEKCPVSYNHVRVTSEDVTPEQIAEALTKEPTPAYRHVHVGTTLTAEDFAKAQFARHKDGRIAARLDVDSLPWCVQSPMTYYTWRSDVYMAAEGWSIVTPAPSTPREALALAADLAYEPEGDTMPERAGHVTVWDNGDITVSSEGFHFAAPAAIDGGRRLLLDPPAPVTPAWHTARIVEATCRGRVGQWARTATDGLWVSLDGESREAYTPDLSDVTVIVPGEVEA